MRATITKWLILIVLGAYVVAINVWADRKAENEKITGVEVEILGASGADSVTHKGVMTELARFDGHLLGQSSGSIDTRKIERWLSGFSNFENVECVITSRNRLRVLIEPMRPEVRIFTGNDSYYINKDGKRISAKAEFFTDVPVVSGRFTKEFPPKSILPVTRFIARDALLRELVTMIEVKDKDNIILIPRISGHVINIGDGSGLERKKRALLSVYRQVMPYKGWDYYDTISVKFNGLVVATRRDKNLPVHTLPLEDETDLEEAALEAQHLEPETGDQDTGNRRQIYGY